ncbi:MAG: ABC transporter permease [Anaerolineae bacterium]|nr:ABC transporter permease [Thermoflexus sp.]MDW8065272.1 ABC transporter permease [Anaerolineae bacterium]
MSRRAEVLLAAGILLILWHVIAEIVRRPILPTPMTVGAALVRELPGDLALHFLASAGRVMISIALSIATAAPLGLVLGLSPRLHGLISPFLYILYPIPKVVLVPILILFFGVGDLAKILLIFLILFFQILVLVRDAAAGLRPELLLSVRSLGAGRRALFRFVYLPASLPAILTAVRQSIGTAVAVLYLSELLATRYGLGYYIYIQASTFFNYPAMYAGIILMSALGLVLYLLVDALERRWCRWMFPT